MDIKIFCLGALVLRDASGYEIKKTLEGPFNHFYDASFGSIYPALNKLAQDGFVDVRQVSQDSRPSKKVYSITQSGRLYLLDSLSQTPKQDRVRSEFLAQMLFSFLYTPSQIQNILSHRISEHKAAIEDLTLAPESEECTHGGPDFLEDVVCNSPANKSIEFVMGFGKAIHEASLKYIEDNRHLLEAASISPTPHGYKTANQDIH